MKINRIGVDIGKNWFHLCAVARNGEVLWRKKLKREQWIATVCDLTEPGMTTIGMEACGGAHHWARLLGQRGYLVKLIAPQFVKPYVASNKTDHADAEAIAEAMSRPKMRFVPVKTVAQQEIQSLHRIRDELIKSRTAKANQTRGLIAEFGIVAPLSLTQLRRAIPVWLEEYENGLTDTVRELLNGLWSDLRHLDERINNIDIQIQRAAKSDAVASKLMQLRGVGPVVATAIAAALGDGTAFRNGRDFAVSIGLTPRQHSTGGKERLLGISKRGDSYLRKQMIHGARSAVTWNNNHDDGLSRWIERLSQTKHTNVVAVALAAKTARMAWALIANESEYDPTLAAA